MNLVSHEASVAVFLAVLLLISLSNLWGMRRLRRCAVDRDLPRASILVPARNEEENIGACLTSLLAQEYADFEVVVLDDNSADGTPAAVERVSSPRLRVLRGAPLPPGWVGKNWACHQLASAAKGEVLLFTDADTRHHPQALALAVTILQRGRFDFLSVLPEQTLVSWGDRLVVPMLAWSQQTFYPIALLRRLRCPALTTAIGQYMLVRRSAYDAAGGFAGIRNSVIDDCDLVRAVARAGLRWTLLDGAGRVSARMYGSFRDASRGFAKNLFARFRYNLLGFAFVWTWLVWVTWQPLILLAAWAVAPHRVPDPAAAYAGAACVANWLLWLLSDARFRVRLDHAFYAPVTVLLTFGIAVRSVAWRLLGRGTWKDRPLPRPRDGMAA